MTALWVALAGSLGAVARFALDDLARALPPSRFPWPILPVNVTGPLLLGVVTGLGVSGGEPSAWCTVVGVGFCGGCTTFCTVSWDTVAMVRRPAYALALANGLVTPALTLGAGALVLGLGGASASA